ncbi:Uveal autoantigen with coiled-coil domains and ankyrin repeats isoform 1 [Theobroma cacao]|uniref:Uveal autoantigen with coiled-coil domains and ankyrin repeats isoform 1 n=1 Tax=Theobroma cacao TaxID=3641 RepID=A0A061EW44_THECC|nr:Uveal autoantigen with coiled-coil domains and ankyrin repeats isoform 1 [Theobroma cacao]
MATSDSTPPLPVTAPLAPKKENMTPVGSKIAELNESRTELLSRIQGLKQDLQNWRSKLDTQVKIYRDLLLLGVLGLWYLADEVAGLFYYEMKELTELKKTLNVEVEQLRTEFQELRTTLHQQQEDVTASLRNLGLQDVSEGAKEAEDPKIEGKDEQVHTSPLKENGKEVES